MNMNKKERLKISNTGLLPSNNLQDSMSNNRPCMVACEETKHDDKSLKHLSTS